MDRFAARHSQEKERVEIDEDIIHLNSDNPFTWADIKHIEFQDKDIIKCEYCEPFFSENNSWDGHFIFCVTRPRMETDEEYNERMENHERSKKEMAQRRYNSYLKMKAQFDPQNLTEDEKDKIKNIKFSE